MTTQTATLTRCPDCGHPTDRKLCNPCADVAKALGFTAQQRVAVLTAAQPQPALLDEPPQ